VTRLQRSFGRRTGEGTDFAEGVEELSPEGRLTESDPDGSRSVSTSDLFTRAKVQGGEMKGLVPVEEGAAESVPPQRPDTQLGTGALRQLPQLGSAQAPPEVDPTRLML
jgi:hypothetical protein